MNVACGNLIVPDLAGTVRWNLWTEHPRQHMRGEKGPDGERYWSPGRREMRSLCVGRILTSRPSFPPTYANRDERRSSSSDRRRAAWKAFKQNEKALAKLKAIKEMGL